MMIPGCDFHPSWQQVSWLDTETGETGEQKLAHAEGEVQQFYRVLHVLVLIGMDVRLPHPLRFSEGGSFDCRRIGGL